MCRCMASTSAISWGVAFLAAAAIQSRPRWDVYHVRPSTLNKKYTTWLHYRFSGLNDRVEKNWTSVGVFYLLVELLTSWCLWPAVRPMADACWGTSLHQRSPAALCPGDAAGAVPLLLSAPPNLFSPPWVACGAHCFQYPPTRKFFHCQDALHVKFFSTVTNTFFLLKIQPKVTESLCPNRQIF